MKKETLHLDYEVFDTIDELSNEDAFLLREAGEATKNSYAPYSKFRVGAVARMGNGELVSGSNQENASYPAGICAERVLLSTASSLFPGIPIKTIAVSYRSTEIKSDHPIAPCGICRQSLQEFKERVKQPIRLILGGLEGKVYIIDDASALMPFSFDGKELG
jgi:cytidine deaminase